MIIGVPVMIRWNNKITTIFIFIRFNTARTLLVLSLAGLLCGCSSPLKEIDDEKGDELSAEVVDRAEVNRLNEQLNFASSSNKAGNSKIAVGDVLMVHVLHLKEINREYHVDSQGDIHVPLIEPLQVRGLRVVEAQQKLADELEKDLLHNPQVTITVTKIQTQEVAVMGAVTKPNIYKVNQGRTVYEMLSLAGGFTSEVGRNLYIKTTQVDPNTGVSAAKTMSIDISDLFDNESVEAVETQFKLKRMFLGDGDSVIVSRAGYVYIDGPISNPGKYSLTGDLTITQLLAVAGGGKYEASDRKVRVLRKEGKEVNIHEVNVRKIRNNEEADFLLQDGDIVTVGKSAFKSATKNFFDYFLRLLILF